MNEVSMIGLDLAKNVFQAYGARADGSDAFRPKVSRAQLLKFIGGQPPCIVAMEACAGAHYCGRESELDPICISPYRPPAHERPQLRGRTHDRT